MIKNLNLLVHSTDGELTPGYQVADRNNGQTANKNVSVKRLWEIWTLKISQTLDNTLLWRYTWANNFLKKPWTARERWLKQPGRAGLNSQGEVAHAFHRCWALQLMAGHRSSRARQALCQLSFLSSLCYLLVYFQRHTMLNYRFLINLFKFYYWDFKIPENEKIIQKQSTGFFITQ